MICSYTACRARIEQEVGWHNFRKYASSPVPEIQAGKTDLIKSRFLLYFTYASLSGTAILLGNLALDSIYKKCV